MGGTDEFAEEDAEVAGVPIKAARQDFAIKGVVGNQSSAGLEQEFDEGNFARRESEGATAVLEAVFVEVHQAAGKGNGFG